MPRINPIIVLEDFAGDTIRADIAVSAVQQSAYDGENYNIGFISVTDTPYSEMIEAAKELNSELYKRRFSN